MRIRLMLVVLGLGSPSLIAEDATQVRCREVDPGSKQRTYALIQHENQWQVMFKSKSHPRWIRLPLLRYKPKLTDSTLLVDYTSPLGGVRVEWSIKGKNCSLFISNLHELEVNDPDYPELNPDIDEMNTKRPLTDLSFEIGKLKIKPD